MRHSIKISEIKIPPRMRKEMGDVSGLADSISRNGLIQPIVLTPTLDLVAGERRLRAHQQLGMDVIDYVFVKEMPDDVREELEFEENFYRKSMTWQEEALGMLSIYRKKKRRGALEGFEENWHKTIAEMFGMSIGSVNYILAVAVKLERELKMPADARRYHNFQSVSEAYRLGLLAEKEDEANQRLANLAKQNSNTEGQRLLATKVLEEVRVAEAKPDILAEAKARYQANPLNVVPFEQYWDEKKRLAEEAANTIYLSNTIIKANCIEYMNLDENAGRFDHIITDPPYAIDMEMLNQQNSHGGMNDIDRVEDAHQVEENKTLMAKFFPAAFRCTKEKAFVIVCGDAMLWQYMYDLATASGFAVQRWPFIWRKVNQSVMNNCAQFNTTKDYEIAMICRKPGTSMMKKWNTSIQDGSNVEVKKLTGHPFAKPFELTKALVEMVSVEQQLILEPFAGAGSMAIQMLRMNRRVVAMDKEEHWYNQLLENVKQQYYLKLNPKFVFK